jgi:hypothetical protein
MFVAAGEHGGWGLGGDRLTCSVHSLSSDTSRARTEASSGTAGDGHCGRGAAAEPPGSSFHGGQQGSPVAIEIVGEARGRMSTPRNSALIQCS